MEKWDNNVRNTFDVCRWFNIQLTTAFNITTTVHWSVLALILWLMIVSPFSAGMVCIALLSVVPHEYGHALAARWYGIKTHRIVIYPVGGIAFIEANNIEKWREFVIAAAGPLVSLALAIIGLLLFWLQGPTPHYVVDNGVATVVNEYQPGLWFYIFAVNMVLVIFNVLPIFPMDGGRMLRGVLSMFMNHVTSTRICVHVSMALGGFLAILGLMYGNIMLTVSMILICMMGRNELEMAELKQRQEKEK